MVIGILSLELRIPCNRSLKGKRMIINSIKARMRNRFNVAVAEVADNDRWDRAVIGLSTVSTDTAHAHALLSSVVEFVDGIRNVDLLNYDIEML